MQTCSSQPLQLPTVPIRAWEEDMLIQEYRIPMQLPFIQPIDVLSYISPSPVDFQDVVFANKFVAIGVVSEHLLNQSANPPDVCLSVDGIVDGNGFRLQIVHDETGFRRVALRACVDEIINWVIGLGSGV